MFSFCKFKISELLATVAHVYKCVPQLQQFNSLGCTNLMRTDLFPFLKKGLFATLNMISTVVFMKQHVEL